MLAIFMTTFREGLEALLIISIAMAFLHKTGNALLLRPLFLGAVTAVAGSAALGVYLARTGALSSVWEGWLALAAAMLIISCVVHMTRHGKKMSQEIRQHLTALTKGKLRAVWWSVFLFAVFMVGREGVEAATLIAALASTASGLSLAVSAAGGFGLAAGLAWLWSRYGQRVNVGLLFRVTGAFLAVFSVQLVIYAFHEFSEAGALPVLDNTYWHNATEAYGPGGEYGVWLTYSLILVPMGLMVWDWLSRQVWLAEKA